MKGFYWTIMFALLAVIPWAFVPIEKSFASSDVVKGTLTLNQRDYTGVIINSGQTQGEMRFSISGKTLKMQVAANGLRPDTGYAVGFYSDCQGKDGFVLIGSGKASSRGDLRMKSTVILPDEIFRETTPLELAKKLAPWLIPASDVAEIVDQSDLVLGRRYHLGAWRPTESLLGTPSKPCLPSCQGAENDLGVELFLPGMLDFHKSFGNICDQECEELCQNEKFWCRSSCSTSVKSTQLMHILCTASCTSQCINFPSSCDVCQPQCDDLYGSFDIDGCNAACDSKYTACTTQGGSTTGQATALEKRCR